MLLRYTYFSGSKWYMYIVMYPEACGRRHCVEVIGLIDVQHQYQTVLWTRLSAWVVRAAYITTQQSIYHVHHLLRMTCIHRFIVRTYLTPVSNGESMNGGRINVTITTLPSHELNKKYRKQGNKNRYRSFSFVMLTMKTNRLGPVLCS